MSGVSITCDRQGRFWRVAVWQGRELRDLYIDKTDDPNLTDAVVGGKVVRVLAGQKAAWLNCGLPEKVYVENVGAIRTGGYCVARIKSTHVKTKAWRGVLVKAADAGEKTGLLVEPPFPWQRAIEDLKDSKITSIVFSHREDCENGSRWIRQNRPSIAAALNPLSKEPVHPELDDIIDCLRKPVVSLPCGGAIVIQQTEALVAVDVNGGEATNPLTVNLQAVREAARQIRLRNLGGIIVMDCLKMKARTDKAKALNALNKATADDPAGVHVFGLTKLGLIEMTRTRRGPSLQDTEEGI